MHIIGWCSTLCEKCPNTVFSLVRIFPHSDWIWRDTPYLDTFHAVPGEGWTFTGYFFDNLFSSMPDIRVCLNYFFFWNWDFRVHTLWIMLPKEFFHLVIYVTFLFWDGVSNFCSARFCIWFVVLRMLRGFDIIFHGSKLLMVNWYFSLWMMSDLCWSFLEIYFGREG